MPSNYHPAGLPAVEPAAPAIESHASANHYPRTSPIARNPHTVGIPITCHPGITRSRARRSIRHRNRNRHANADRYANLRCIRLRSTHSQGSCGQCCAKSPFSKALRKFFAKDFHDRILPRENPSGFAFPGFLLLPGAAGYVRSNSGFRRRLRATFAAVMCLSIALKCL
jgi:hypothetical protein